MPSLQKVHTDQAPAAIGPYSQAIVANGMVFTAGQIALDPVSMQLIEGDVVPQTEQVMKNLRAVLQQAGSDLSAVVKTTVFLTDRGLLPAYRSARERLMGDHAPASTLLFVSGLADPAFVVEIEAEAVG